jgi:phage terminase large subunit
MIEDAGLIKDFRITRDEIINLKSGSVIMFMGLRTNNGDNTARLKSIPLTTLLIEEAEELTDEILFDKICLSLRQTKVQNRVILVMNPATKRHWVYERFYKDEGIREDFTGIVDGTCYIHSTFQDLDKKHLDVTFLKDAEKLKKKSQRRYDNEILGKWLDKSEGTIFSKWELGQFPNDMDTYFGVDWGFGVDPSALIEVAIDHDRMLIYMREHFYKPEMETPEIIRSLRKAAGTKLIVAEYASGGDRVIAECKRSGLNIVACQKKTLDADIKKLQDYTFIVDPKSKNLIDELETYVYDKRGIPHEFDNHLMDAMRYVVMDRVRPKKSGVYNIR